MSESHMSNRKNKFTGSCFDQTRISAALERPGAHRPTATLPDPNVFDGYHKATQRRNPKAFQKKGTTVLNVSGSTPEIDPTKKVLRKKKPQAFARRANPANTEFRRFYERGDLPMQLDHQGVANKLQWKIDVDKLDFHHYLPLFFSGIRETEEPYAQMAELAIHDCLSIVTDRGKVLPVLPQLIIPLKDALNTRDPEVVVKTMLIMQKLAECEEFTGQALVPYYRQLLPVLNILSRNTPSIGDSIDYGQRKGMSIGTVVNETLQKLEQTGGEDAFINIKYMVPIYQTCVL